MINKKEKISETPFHTLGKIILVWLVQTGSFILVAILFQDKIQILDIRSAFAFTAILALLNAVLWPLFSKFMLPITVLTFGLFTFVLNGILIVLASNIVKGIEVKDLWAAIIVAIFLTAFNTIISSLLALDDDQSYFRNSVKKAMLKRFKPKTEKMGILFLEIDGLAEPILREAMKKGYAPNMKSWIENYGFKLNEWETDLSSQTGASQAGILLGSNKNMPAFRWVEKGENNKIMTSNAPKDCPLIEKTHASGKGLLKKNGASRANLFSGEADDSIFTYSKISDFNVKKAYNPAYYSFFSKPYNYVSTLTYTIKDVFVEIRSRRFQEKNDVVPRLGKEKRGGVFPLLRAFTTTFLRDLTAYTLVGDVYAGQADVIYATFVGYDEVAHHSGIADPDALNTLKRLDKHFGRIEMAVNDAPRKYHIVVLSDHGQTLGSTFKQRYGMTLEDLVKTAMPSETISKSMLATDEDLGHLNIVLSEYAKDEDKLIGKTVNKVLKGKKEGNIVEITEEDLNPTEKIKEFSKQKTSSLGNKQKNEIQDIQLENKLDASKQTSKEEDSVIVLASGNLGLVYFTKFKERLTYEDIQKTYPKMIKTLTNHEGVGFILVNSQKQGPMAIGKDGTYFLDTDKIQGKNPLANFGPNAARHLKRTNSFKNTPDILVNSFFDPKTMQGAAFEELIGFHGGMGGYQTRPFVLHPKELNMPNEKVIGAEELHKVFVNWTNEL